MTFVKWGMAAALALAFSPAYAGDAQKEMTQAKQEAQEQKAEAQQEASETKADAQREASAAQADAQKDMREADREASEKTAEAQREASEKTGEAREDMKEEGREVRASDDRAAGATAGSAATTDPDKAALSKTAKETLQKLHASSQMEVGMARLAKDKAQNDKVKDLAEKIEEDHQEFADKAAEIARERNIELAAHGDMDKNREHVEQMEKMQGASFDRHFAQMMEKEHKKEIADLRKAQTKLTSEGDKDVAELVEDALPKMEEHEKLAMEAQTELGSQQRQGRRGAMESDRSSPSATTGDTTGARTGETENSATIGNKTPPDELLDDDARKDSNPAGSSAGDGSSEKKY